MSTRTLKDVLARKQEQKERNARPDFDWFTLAKNDTRKIRFLQELDTDMRNYEKTRGTALFLVEHVSPVDFTRRAVCTFDSEGQCFGCEKDQEQPFIQDGDNKIWHPWGQRENFYVHVVDEKGKIFVLSRPTSGKFFDAIVDEAVEENDNSIVDVTFKISKGDRNNSPWEIKKTNAGFDLPEIPELVDLETAVARKVKYAEQRNFYIPNGKAAPVEEEKAETKRPADDW